MTGTRLTPLLQALRRPRSLLDPTPILLVAATSLISDDEVYSITHHDSDDHQH
jgi:hypothetical protein